MATRKLAPKQAFGKVIQELRKERKMTQEALALEAGTERSHISAIERAEKGPTLSTVFQLARALSISASELIAKVEARAKRD